jgi:hypothetical protein
LLNAELTLRKLVLDYCVFFGMVALEQSTDEGRLAGT